ncbi:hypothetical protein E2C01_029286 [Portunus trituberculatus]|uniref:Uncharacterized protein n=1 Tax=Portunus trituberculatus TaxID=210409 RepID=A0A5B7EMM1_PORTR|nr:hypothetical protein [Portunus trituberculatus]
MQVPLMLTSSEASFSPQSLSPSQCHRLEMHFPEAQVNCSEVQVASEAFLEACVLDTCNSCKTQFFTLAVAGFDIQGKKNIPDLSPPQPHSPHSSGFSSDWSSQSGSPSHFQRSGMHLPLLHRSSVL